MRARISWIDVKLGIRMLIKHPALTLIGGLGLAVGIAISVGFYHFTGAYIYPTLPLDEGERIVALENRDIALDNEDRRSLHDFFTWREELGSVEDLAAFRTVVRNLVAGDAVPEPALVAEMTASGFRLARVPPLLGRYLAAEDEREGVPPVVVIGYDVWRARFAGDPDVVGRDIRLDGVPHTIVGVMPAGFAFPQNHRFWTPLRADPSDYGRREGPAIFIAGRLAPGVTKEEAQAELTAIGRRTAAAFPETHERLRPMVMRYTHALTDVQGITLWEVVRLNLMMSLVLIVVALNVAVLVYARTAARQGEIAMRSALGASRGRIVAQLFAEALMLSVAASALGLAIARVGVGMSYRILEMDYEAGVPFWVDYGLRPDTVLFSVGAAVLVAVVTGVLPGLQATGRRLERDLRRLGDAGMRLGRTWTALIVAQVAVAVAALPAAVNMGWTAIREVGTRPTYPAEEFATAVVAPEPEPAPVPAADAGGSPREGDVPFGDRLAELMRRLAAEPRVVGVTFLADLPGGDGPIRIEGVPAPPDRPAGHRAALLGVHAGFVEVLGLRVLSGRALEPADAGGGATPVVVSQAFVRQVLGGGDALGRRIRHVSDAERAAPGGTAPGPWHEIVGVVQDLQTNVADTEVVAPVVFHALAPDQVRQASLTVRLRGSTPAAFAPVFRRIAADVDPSIRLGTVGSLADRYRQGRLIAHGVGLAVGLVLLSALLLSAAGVYAMMSFTVTQRRKEIGIRSALGARPRQVLRSIFARAAGQIALGLAVGVAAAVVVERLTGGGLVDGRGAVLFPTIAVAMAIIGLLAALGPARRGLGIQPTEALRGDG